MNVATFLLLNQTTNAAIASTRKAREEKQEHEALEFARGVVRREEALYEARREQMLKRQAENAQRQAEARQRTLLRKEAYIKSLSPSQLRRYNRLEFVKNSRASFSKTPTKEKEISRYIDIEGNVISVVLIEQGGTIQVLLDPKEYMKRSFKKPVSPLDKDLQTVPKSVKETTTYKEFKQKRELASPPIKEETKEIVVVEPLVDENIIEDEPKSKVGNTIGVLSIIGILFVIGYIYMKATL